MGRQEHPKVVAEFGGVYDDAELGGYVAMIGGALVANSELPRYAFTFTILNSPVINAFALPGGYVYVTRGLMALANSEAELAGVLAHEIGHVTARHPAQRYSRGVIANLGVTLLGILTDNPQVNQVAQIGGGLYLMRFSREEEYESDLLGVGYLSRTGYNPWGQARFLKSLGHKSVFEIRDLLRTDLPPNAELAPDWHPIPQVCSSNVLRKAASTLAAASACMFGITWP